MIALAHIRVLYGDTDIMAHAYYGNYLRWFEAGRTEWFRATGSTYRELENEGVFLPVTEAHCRYRRPAFYDDLIEVHTRFRFEGGARLRFDYEVRREGEAEVLADGYTIHACVDRDRKVMRPPKGLREHLASLETRGEAAP